MNHRNDSFFLKTYSKTWKLYYASVKYVSVEILDRNVCIF